MTTEEYEKEIDRLRYLIWQMDSANKFSVATKMIGAWSHHNSPIQDAVDIELKKFFVRMADNKEHKK